jgi:hypothetical protein
MTCVSKSSRDHNSFLYGFIHCRKRLATSRLGTGRSLTFFTVYSYKKFSVSAVEHQGSPEKFVSFQPFQTTLNVLSDGKDPNYAVIRKKHGSTACTGALFPK